jgi:hypothetical protein
MSFDVIGVQGCLLLLIPCNDTSPFVARVHPAFLDL